MKRSLVSLALASLATTTFAMAQPGSADDVDFGRTPPTYPEHANTVQVQFG